MAKKAFRKTWAIQSNQTQSIRLSMDPFHTNLRGYDVNQCDVCISNNNNRNNYYNNDNDNDNDNEHSNQ